MNQGDAAAASEAEFRKEQVPFGMSRHIVFALYFIVIALIGLAPCATDPMIQLMKLNNAYPYIEDPVARQNQIESVVGFAVSCVVLSGIVTGPLLNLLGCKFSGLSGTLAHVGAYFLLFLTDKMYLHLLAGVLFGISFQLILNAHLSIGCLYPRNASLALSIVSAAPDLSFFIPPFLVKRVQAGNSVPAVLVSHCAIVLAFCAAVDLFFLPMRPFVERPSATILEEEDEEGAPLFSGQLLETEAAGANGLEVVSATGGSPPLDEREALWGATVMQQLFSLPSLLFLPFFILSFARKKHFSTFIRATFIEMEGSDTTPVYANWLTDLYNSMVAYGGLTATAFGAGVDAFGINAVVLFSTTLSLVWTGLLMINVMSLQLLTVIVFLVWQSFIMGLSLSYFATVFGFKNLATMQGIVSCITGVFSVAQDFLWPTFVTETLGGYRHANKVLFIVSVITSIFPILCIVLVRRRLKAACSSALGLAAAPIYERSSVRMLEKDFNRRSRTAAHK